MSALIEQLIDDTGYISTQAIADEFHTTVKEIGSHSGLSPDTILKRESFQSKTSQKRLRDIVMIINRVLPWCGTPLQVYTWFRSEPNPSFGDLTAEGMVKRDMSEAVLEYLDRIEEGGFA